MTVPKRCAALGLVDAPEVSVAALVELTRLLAAAGQPPTHASISAEASHPQTEVGHAGHERTEPAGAGWSSDDDLRWDELPASLQAEVRERLRCLLVAAASEVRAEGRP